MEGAMSGVDTFEYKPALQNNDVATARMYLAQAMLEAQAGH